MMEWVRLPLWGAIAGYLCNYWGNIINPYTQHGTTHLGILVRSFYHIQLSMEQLTLGYW